MIVLGIDPGTKMGWAALDCDGQVLGCGLHNLERSSRWEGAGVRVLRARQAYLELLRLYEPQLVAYEEVRRHAGTAAAHLYGALTGQLTSLCESQSVPYTSIPVGQVKKTATGKGNASKALMIAAAEQEWNVPGVDENTADALWIARTAQLQEEVMA